MGGQEVEQEVVLACVKDIIGEKHNLKNFKYQFNVVLDMFFFYVDAYNSLKINSTFPRYH